MTVEDRLRLRALHPRIHQMLTERENARSIDVLESLRGKIVGQSHALDRIVPHVRTFQAGLSPEGRPAGVFLLLGPTGTGKTRTVEALAEVLHGSARNLLKIDCGEFQMEHEVAKLIGAPPGYLGHRETHPMLSQAKVNAVASEHCGLSIVLFDEVEKAAPALTRLLLGILDKATLHLGDNNVVSFENCLIFLTSNIGAQRMMQAMGPGFGFASNLDVNSEEASEKMERIAMSAARRQFSPEFLNRIDAAITYHPLSEESLGAILDQQLIELQAHVLRKMGSRAFRIAIAKNARNFLLRRGTSTEFGAREIKRTVHKMVAQPLAAMVADGRVSPGGTVVVRMSTKGDVLKLQTAA